MLGVACEGHPLTEPEEPDDGRELLGTHSDIHLPPSLASCAGFPNDDHIDRAHLEPISDEVARGLGGGGQCATSPQVLAYHLAACLCRHQGRNVHGRHSPVVQPGRQHHDVARESTSAEVGRLPHLPRDEGVEVVEHHPALLCAAPVMLSMSAREPHRPVVDIAVRPVKAKIQQRVVAAHGSAAQRLVTGPAVGPEPPTV